MQQDKVKIIIADDHAIVRKGLIQIIAQTPDLEVVAEAENGKQLFERLKEVYPHVVILDINMPGKSGWDVLNQLKDEYPELPVLILSIAPEQDYAVQFFKAGADGYLNKKSAPRELVDAIRRLAQGRKYISSTLAEVIAADLGGERQQRVHETLSPREFQILCLIASGKRVGEIGEELSLSAATISSHRAKILKKMQMTTNAQLTSYAFKFKLIE